MIVKQNNKILKGVLWVLVCLVVGVNFFLLNVVLHELGHYVAADYYDLDPEIEFELNNVADLGLSFELEGGAVASTRFINNGNGNDLFVITAMGPFINLLLGVCFLFGLVFIDWYWFEEICIIGVVISFMSFVMNLIPMGGSDGVYLLALL